MSRQDVTQDYVKAGSFNAVDYFKASGIGILEAKCWTSTLNPQPSLPNEAEAINVEAQLAQSDLLHKERVNPRTCRVQSASDSMTSNLHLRPSTSK